MTKLFSKRESRGPYRAMRDKCRNMGRKHHEKILVESASSGVGRYRKDPKTGGEVAAGRDL